MNRLPKVLQNEIWEYVRGDRKFWQRRQFRLVLTELIPEKEFFGDDGTDQELKSEIEEEQTRGIARFQHSRLDRASNLRQGLTTGFAFPQTQVDLHRMYSADGTKRWYVTWEVNGVRAKRTEWVKTLGPARQDFHRFMILAAELTCGFRTL
jgi:hypothetical protein